MSENFPNFIIKKALNNVDDLAFIFKKEKVSQKKKFLTPLYYRSTRFLLHQHDYYNAIRDDHDNPGFFYNRHFFPTQYGGLERRTHFEKQILNFNRYNARSRLNQFYRNNGNYLNLKFTDVNAFSSFLYSSLFTFNNIYNPLLTSELQSSNLDNFYSSSNNLNYFADRHDLLHLKLKPFNGQSNLTSINAVDTKILGTSESNFIFEQLTPETGTSEFISNNYRMFHMDTWFDRSPWFDFYTTEKILDSSCIESFQEDDYLVDENRLFEG